MNQKKKREKSSEKDPCLYAECELVSEKFGFCLEHHDWFMSGLLQVDGSRVEDFEKRIKEYLEKSTHLKLSA